MAYCTYLCCISQSVSFANCGNIEIMKYIDLEILTLISVSTFLHSLLNKKVKSDSSIILAIIPFLTYLFLQFIISINSSWRGDCISSNQFLFSIPTFASLSFLIFSPHSPKVHWNHTTNPFLYPALFSQQVDNARSPHCCVNLLMWSLDMQTERLWDAFPF